MRLIDTSTLQLEEFQDANHSPPYAVLSHRWGAEEVTLEELEKTRNDIHAPDHEIQTSVEAKAGYHKIRSFCKIARARGLLWAWADTCCINKTDAAELSEAINSMARWYALAHVCIVYLADVSSSSIDSGNKDVFQQVEESEWFQRGWTLQELLQPRRLIFYSLEWERLGSLDKDDVLDISLPGNTPHNLWPSRRGFLTSLERASHIRIDDLCVTDQFMSASVAQRMFLASHRQTTKVEDMSYSLMSLFEVNMPLLYGEGSRGSQRLQEEMMKHTTDESVFAWTSRSRATSQAYGVQGLHDGKIFAASPAEQLQRC